MNDTPKYSSTFIFETKDLTDEFHRIDSEIAAGRVPGRHRRSALHARQPEPRPRTRASHLTDWEHD